MEKVINATYNKTQISDFKGNPMIEALPKDLSIKDLIHVLSVYPQINAAEREASDEDRFQYIQRIYHYFQPLEGHLKLQRKISTIIKQSYLNRNPLENEHIQHMNNSYKLLMEGKLPERDIRNISKVIQGISIIGTAGTGKTTSMDRVLNIFPKCIIHSQYEGDEFHITQLPWLKIQCPPEGSTKGLCMNFFRQLDEILKTNYVNRYHNRAQNVLLPIMSHLVRTYNVGALIIDEIQHINATKNGGISLLNFLVTLVNSIGVPVIIVGTNKAFENLNKEFRQALRGNGQGTFVWNRLKKDANWDFFLNGLFNYQWIKKPVKLNEALSEKLYYHSQGITDIVVKLFVASQMEAIIRKTEEITTNTIDQVFNQYFKTLDPMLEAIRSGRDSQIRKFQDIAIDKEELAGDMEDKLSSRDFLAYKNETYEKTKANTERTIKKALQIKLGEKFKNKKMIDATVKDIMTSFKVAEYDIEKLYELAFSRAEERLSKQSRKTKKPLLENELVSIQEKARSADISVYSLLKEDGYIYKFQRDKVQ
jgi:hypothetical protein